MNAEIEEGPRRQRAGLAERLHVGDERIVAVLLSQELIGKKVWTK